MQLVRASILPSDRSWFFSGRDNNRLGHSITCQLVQSTGRMGMAPVTRGWD